MRFKRLGWFEFEDTKRKRLAYERKLRVEREALPLFAEQIEQEQTPVDVVMRERARRWDEQQRKDRQRQAANWREARRRLRSYPPDVAAGLLSYWQRCRYPADPVYLMSMLRMFDRGEIDLVAGPAGLLSATPAQGGQA
jgi:hypothetical protein